MFPESQPQIRMIPRKTVARNQSSTPTAGYLTANRSRSLQQRDDLAVLSILSFPTHAKTSDTKPVCEHHHCVWLHRNFTRDGRTDQTASNRQSDQRSYAINKRYTVARRQKSRTHESITNSNTGCHAYINPNFRPDADSLFNSNRHTFTNPDTSPVADFTVNSNSNRHTFTNPDTSPVADFTVNSDSNRHTFTNPNFSPDGDTLINPNADSHAFTNPDINSLYDTDTGNSGDANSDTRRSSNCQ